MQNSDHDQHEHNQQQHDHNGHHDHESRSHNSGHKDHEHTSGGDHQHTSHHAHMVADFRKRFWISLAATLPILILSPMIQAFLGLEETLRFRGDMYILFVLSSFVFFYGGFPFLKGIYDELRKATPGMMTLIALAITVAYVYSSAVVFGVSGKIFYWELGR
jgi:Cu2+-exporting ATPase